MHIKSLHSWDLSPSEAVRLQKELAAPIRSDFLLSRERGSFTF